MKRRMLSLITALALCLSLCPTWAFAAEGDEPAVPPEGALAEVRLTDGTTTYPTTEAEFRAVFSNNDMADAVTTVTLLKDVDLTGTIRILYGTFTLDLNGKNINFTNHQFSVSYDMVSSNGGSLTIRGSGTVYSKNVGTASIKRTTLP